MVGRRRAFLAQITAIGAGAAVLWLATFVAFAAGDVPVRGAAYLALAIVSAVPVFVGVGAVASQLAPTKRLATALSTGVLAIALALRTVAATSDGLEWLRWTTPLGWASELRPFVDPQPIVLLLPLGTAVLLLVVAGAGPARCRQGSAAVARHRTATAAPARIAGRAGAPLRAGRSDRLAGRDRRVRLADGPHLGRCHA